MITIIIINKMIDMIRITWASERIVAERAVM